jgi:DNA recombination protein RmuC
MTPDILLTLILVIALAVLILRAKLGRPGRVEEALRLELERSRREAEAQSHGLRTEVVGTMASLAGTQQQALEGFVGRLDQFRAQMQSNFAELRAEVIEGLKASGRLLSETLAQLVDAQQQRLEAVGKEIATLGNTQRERLEAVRAELEKIAVTVGNNLEQVRDAVEGRLKEMQASNEERLEQMRATVDEKLQNTLEARLGSSFRQVNDNLEKVYKSVGEMMAQATGLATGVTGLQRVLTGVKTKGIWGEMQLESLLEQVLAPDMYAKNVEIRPGSGQRVEFAVKLPGQGDGDIWLPLDAKLPHEHYERLAQAAELADSEGVEAASRAIEIFVRNAAKEIKDKYISLPYSTDFAVMFLPTEGLYAEVLRRPGLAEALQRECKVVVAGPTTLYAVLNSFQMGFRTLAIQKHSGEVWQLLGAVKTEFTKYTEVIAKVRHKLHEADKHLDKVEVRTRAIGRRLRDVESQPGDRINEGHTPSLSGLVEPPEDDDH